MKKKPVFVSLALFVTLGLASCGECPHTKDETYVVEDIGYAPTCTNNGLTNGKHCDICGEILLAQEIIPALGHHLLMVDQVNPT